MRAPVRTVMLPPGVQGYAPGAAPGPVDLERDDPFALPAPRGQLGVIYLLCFERPYKGARHYLGFALNVRRRIKEHQAGRGSHLTQAVVAAGIGLRCVQTWQGTRDDERRLKRRRDMAALCPDCRERRLARERENDARRRARKKRETGGGEHPRAADRD